ncbi:MAG: TetR/AcrR family transcriptional regulator, partial [Actinomycetota bacterium]
LSRGSIAEVKVERLAKDLGVTKGSFYWHFEDRPALLRAMWQRWAELDTEGVIDEVDADGTRDPANADPAAAIERLFAITFTSAGEFDGVEAAIREWSASDPEVAAQCRTIDERRIGYVAELLFGAGWEPVAARHRAEFLYRVVIGEYVWRRYGGDPIEAAPALDAIRLLIEP